MAEKHLEDDDPFEFVAVKFPVEAGVDAEEAMARCLVEEYALYGASRKHIMQLFRTPQFAGTHAIMLNRGEAFVQQIINDVFGVSEGGV